MPPESSESKSRPELRVDAAHVTGQKSSQPETVEEPVVAEIAERGDAALELLDMSQVRNHAAQLATYLQGVREDLDRRESELNTRAAGSDTEMRSARLWLTERQQQLAERGEELEEREKCLRAAEQRLAAICQEGAKSPTTGDATNDLAARIKSAMDELRKQRKALQDEIAKQRQQIDLRREASLALVRQLLKGIERRRAAAEDEYQQQQRKLRLKQQKAFQEDYQQAAEEFEKRQQYLDGAEALLINGQADLEVQQQQLKMQRERNETVVRELRSDIARQQRKLDEQWQERQEALNRRSQQLDSRQAAIEQAREEVAFAHREALELRLATEELWSKLSDVMPAPALTAELGRIRRKLAESYTLERSAAVREKEQLEATHARLTEQYVNLNAEKKELQDWVKRQQQDIEQQAAQLVAREQELDGQEADNLQRADRWERERRHLQDELRRVMTELRRLKATKSDAFERARAS